MALAKSDTYKHPLLNVQYNKIAIRHK